MRHAVGFVVERPPGFSPAALIGKPRFPDLIQVDAFYDYGHLYSPKDIPGGQGPVDMAGAGFFLHYAVDRFIDIDFNYGGQLKQMITEPPGLGHYMAIAVVFSN